LTDAPLVELHTHVEGALTPARLIALAERHGRPDLVPACLDGSGKSFSFMDFREFLKCYRDATAVLVTPRDYADVARDLVAMLVADGVARCEAAVSYGVLLWRGIDPVAIQGALWEVAQEAQERHRLALRFVPDAVRQFGPDPARRVLDAALRAGPERGVVGFGIGGDELARPAGDFARVCEEARAAGLGVTIHAGEVGGPAQVRDAVLACGAARIGHGVGAVLGPAGPDGARVAPDPAETDATLALLRDRRVFVELCPGANRRLGLVPHGAGWPWRRFVDAGVPCALNTDDRGLFGLDLRGEYARAAADGGLDAAQLARMRADAAGAGFGIGAPPTPR